MISIPEYLYLNVFNKNIEVYYKDDTTLVLSGDIINISECSHRAKLILGLYNTSLPLSKKDNIITIPSSPIINYDNNLFIKSNITNISGITDKKKLEYIYL